MTTTVYAGRFDFEDGGTYCGGWEDGKAHGYGVCTGPKSMGEFSGLWQFGYEVSGVYIWPSGNCYQGQWVSGKRHGLGVEKKQRWIYKGEWSQGFKGRYGMRVSETSGAKYEGTWANGLQDGYGSETYADGGTFFGQMSQGMRNGYGIRKSVSYGVASRYRSKDVKDSLTSLRSEDGDERVQRERDRRFDENRGGFVLRAKSDLTEEVAAGISTGAYMPNSGGNLMTNAINGLLRRRRNSFGQSQDRRVSLRKTILSKLKKQKSVSDIDDVNTIASGGSHPANTNLHPTSAIGRQKKSSFRSTSSNNSVDSRASNRTAPAGLGLNSSSLTHNLGNNTINQDDGEHSFISQDEITDVNCIEVYMGEWKQDKRTGYGIAERSDGLKYEGEWFNNKKNGYGVTTFKDGTKEEGKYRNNVLATDKKKTGKLLLLRSNKLRQKIDAAVNAALKAGQIAQQRADIALARAVNARTKAHAAELAAQQARGDSEYARVRAHEVAPDFIQPGEVKKMPEIILDIDKMNSFGFQTQLPPPSGLGDPVAFNNISPNQYRKMQSSLNINANNEHYNINQINPNDSLLNWQSQQSPQQQSSYTPHSSTPPPLLINQQTSSKISNNNLNLAAASQFYSPSLIMPSHHLQQQHLQKNQFHPSNDQTGQKINDMLGMNQYDAQTLAQKQIHPNYMTQFNTANINNIIPNNKNLVHQNFSFEEQLPNNYFDGGINHRLNLLQQAQSHSFNMDILNNIPNQHIDFLQQNFNNNNNNNNSLFQRNNPKRNTLRRAQRITDNSVEDLTNTDFVGLNPQQQQQLLLIRNQHFSNNSSGQESGLGTGSSVYTNLNNSTIGTHDVQQRNTCDINNKNHDLNNNNNTANNNNINGKQSVNSNISNLDQFLHPPQLPRRKSLPSIVKAKSFKEDETAHSSSDLNNKGEETFIIENGIRKRVTEKSNSIINHNKLNSDEAKSNATDSDFDSKLPKRYNLDDDEQTPQLPRKILIESVTSIDSPKSSSKRVSMPSIPAYLSPKYANKVMSREEANRLSSQRREELRKNREIENNRALKLKNILTNDTISMFFKTTSDCCIQTDDLEYSDWAKVIVCFNGFDCFNEI